MWAIVEVDGDFNVGPVRVYRTKAEAIEVCLDDIEENGCAYSATEASELLDQDGMYRDGDVTVAVVECPVFPS